jgi:dihydrofolate reductase
MRKLIYTINVSIDGCCEHTIGPPDEDVFEYYLQLVSDAGLQVFGRKTYELMVPYWPDVAKNPEESKADREFGEAFVALDKVVFSRTLDSREDGNTKIVRTSLRDEIVKLKQQPGNYILVGGINLPSQLIELGLIDEYRFMVMPIIVGQGRRLFEGASLPEKLRLKLVESRKFESGSILLRYVKQ